MPIFEYRCKNCDHPFEILVRSSAQADVACPACRSEEVTRLLSTFASRSGGPSQMSSPSPRPVTSGGCGPSCGCH
ncbi:MAG: zinc ribbon domain-containing protein [Armatimonadetes bacterium]|nr:zinc ribbon domain-containing protein [Armatimonadota bacterium]